MRFLIALAALTTPLPALAQTVEPYTGRDHVEWSRDAVIYQINTRQFTPEGTLAAAEAELPRLKALGVDILWLMPIHPIGEVNRKGTLGSPYSVTDYKAVRAELGTMDDLKSFVDAAHAQGMKVILDWVANHTAWDHPWASEHPEWYERNWQGNFRSTPYWDWSDIIDLDYSQVALRNEMREALKFWVREADIDGYRADVAGYIPPDFWEDVRADLEAIKPVWMLAEYPDRDAHMVSFDSTYAWDWEKALRQIAAGTGNATSLYGFYSEHASMWPSGAQRMIFTSNHDENSWAGTAYERLGEALPNAFVLLFTSEGIPLLYNGQEAGLDKRLEFFERDPIVWREHENARIFKRLIEFRDANPVLHNAPWGAPMVHVKNSEESKVFSFVRRADDDGVLVLQNYSNEEVTVTLSDFPGAGRWIEFHHDLPEGVAVRPSPVTLEKGTEVSLAPWSSRIYTVFD
ncbi:alpha-amylase family glycosyl hydrolase [Sphingomicrobium sp. XHP0235]|uniref:alpha-amylase family glycosyl hydrolase n=1 Tax=Sphingomicrobium aquimarinum TaxID=3133971 RepID=UPI0031FF398E